MSDQATVKMDMVLPSGIAQAAEAARAATAAGADGLWARETGNDPFLDLATVVSASSGHRVGTNVAVAFARSPFVTAAAAWELQLHSKGNFALGLGTQVKAHIKNRFGMPYHSPAMKLREYCQAIRWIWKVFRDGPRGDFEGEFYQLRGSTFTPYFTPPHSPDADPPILLAAMNPRNCETVGLLGDGIVVHPLHSVDYLKDRLFPQVEAGLRQSDRSWSDIEIVCPVLVALGKEHEELRKRKELARASIAFYGSTRTYSSVLDAHGRPGLALELHELQSAGRRREMAALIDDELLERFVVVGTPTQVAAELRRRYEGVAQRVYVSNPESASTPLLHEVFSSFRAARS